MTNRNDRPQEAAREREPAMYELSFLRRLNELVGNNCGIVVIEFAFILPIMVVLWIASVEVTQILSVDRKVDSMVGAATELIAESTVLTEADMTGLFDMVTGAMDPFDPDTASLSVTAISIDKAGEGAVAWSRTHGEAPLRTVGTPMNVILNGAPATPGTQMILLEAFYPYRPAIGYVLNGLVTLKERKLFQPRYVNALQYCSDDMRDCR